MRPNRSIVLIALLAVVLAGCGGKQKTFAGDQLAPFMLNQSDVPDGIDFVADTSGPQALEELVSSDEEKSKLASLSFQAGYQANFANQSAIDLFNQKGTPLDAEIVTSLAIVFKTADKAHQALVFEHDRDLRTGTGIQTISVPKLGEETIASYGTPDALPFPGYLIYWRIGNALFVVLLAGGPSALHVDTSEANSLAKIVNDRANK
jgi:hypothetical protein